VGCEDNGGIIFRVVDCASCWVNVCVRQRVGRQGLQKKQRRSGLKRSSSDQLSKDCGESIAVSMEPMTLKAGAEAQAGVQLEQVERLKRVDSHPRENNP
jgi:hypothetical protein